MTDFLPPMDGAAIVAALADPAIRIVSLTVTEGGYFVIPPPASSIPRTRRSSPTRRTPTTRRRCSA